MLNKPEDKIRKILFKKHSQMIGFLITMFLVIQLGSMILVARAKKPRFKKHQSFKNVFFCASYRSSFINNSIDFYFNFVFLNLRNSA